MSCVSALLSVRCLSGLLLTIVKVGAVVCGGENSDVGCDGVSGETGAAPKYDHGVGVDCGGAGGAFGGVARSCLGGIPPSFRAKILSVSTCA